MTADHLTRARESWDLMARQDAMYAIMTEPGKQDHAWDPAAFFETGAQDVTRHLDVLSSLLTPLGLEEPWNRSGGEPATALDFGCGIGRLSRALCFRVTRVIGLDAAPAMIAKAKELHPVAWIDFREAPGPDLEIESGSIDLVMTLITLQHLETELQHRYLRELLRVLRPGGCAIIGTMAAPLRTPKPHEAPEYEPGGSWRMEMHGIDVSAAVRTLRLAGGRVLDLRMDRAQSEWSDIWLGITYYAVKLETA